MSTPSLPVGAYCAVPTCRRVYRLDKTSSQQPPMILGCGQIICGDCAVKYAADPNARCPVCFNPEPFDMVDTCEVVSQYVEECYHQPTVLQGCSDCVAIGITTRLASSSCSCGASWLCGDHAKFHDGGGHVLTSLRPFSGMPEECSEHTEEAVDRFCTSERCGKACCANCLVLRHRPGPTHTVSMLPEAVEHYTGKLTPLQDTFTNGLAVTTAGRNTSEQAIRTIADSASRSIQSIHESRDRLIDAIKKRAAAMEAEVVTIAQTKTETLENQIKYLDLVISQLSLTVEIVKAALASKSPLCMANTLRTMLLLRRMVKPYPGPAVPPVLNYVYKSDEDGLTGIINQWGKLVIE